MSAPFFLLEDSDQQLIALGEEAVFTGRLEDCQAFIDLHKGKYIFTALAYDLKNQVEQLHSENPGAVFFPDLYLVVPKCVIAVKENKEQVLYGEMTDGILSIWKELKSKSGNTKEQKVRLKPRIDRETYLHKVRKLQDHIQRGDIYEVTFCQEFYANGVVIDPYKTYDRLKELTKAPFSGFVRIDGKYLICGSPERFLKKEGDRLISQPIKGTAKRGSNAKEDAEIKESLRSSEKERAENVMIVDLVRNDLSRIAQRNSVQVDELFGLYTFSTVHQLISTVSAEVKEETTFVDILKALFPMGSMTGAPKISAMQLIEKYESFRRGLFSGSIGYMTPDGDFDLNVVIRSILYDPSTAIVTYPVGGAITIQSSPEAEYDECLLKGEAMQKALSE